MYRNDSDYNCITKLINYILYFILKLNKIIYTYMYVCVLCVCVCTFRYKYKYLFVFSFRSDRTGIECAWATDDLSACNTKGRTTVCFVLSPKTIVLGRNRLKSVSRCTFPFFFCHIVNPRYLHHLHHTPVLYDIFFCYSSTTTITTAVLLLLLLL